MCAAVVEMLVKWWARWWLLFRSCRIQSSGHQVHISYSGSEWLDTWNWCEGRWWPEGMGWCHQKLCH